MLPEGKRAGRPARNDVFAYAVFPQARKTQVSDRAIIGECRENLSQDASAGAGTGRTALTATLSSRFDFRAVAMLAAKVSAPIDLPI